MSIHCLSWCMRHSEATLGSRLVLFVLAEFAHDDGTLAFPSIATIGERARMSRRAVQAALRKLEREGAIEKADTRPSGTVVYNVLMGGVETAPPTDPGGVVDDVGGRRSNARSVIDPSLFEPNGSQSESTGEQESSTEITTTTIGRVSVAPMKYDRREVPAPVLVDAVLAVDYWNCCTGQAYRAYDGMGAPTASLRVVVGAMLKFPEVRTRYQDMIRVALRRPWWKDDTPDTGVVFGPNVVQRMLQSAGVNEEQIWEGGVPDASYR